MASALVIARLTNQPFSSWDGHVKKMVQVVIEEIGKRLHNLSPWESDKIGNISNL
jgi:hypothetical protein